MADILNIATIAAPEEFITIDGERYPLRSVDAMTLTQIAILKRDGPRLGNLLIRTDELTDDEGKETSQLLARFCNVILDAPPAVQAKLHDQHRMAIVHAFTTLWPMPTQAKAPTTRAKSTGARRSRVSNGSMVALRNAG
jgi:hypothetical protein